MSERDEEVELGQDDEVDAQTSTYAQTPINIPQMQQMAGSDLHERSVSDC